MGGILAPIDQSLVGYVPGAPGFYNLVGATLLANGTAADGFDSDLAAVMALVPGTDAELAAAESVLADVFNGAAAFDALDLTGLVNDWAGGVPIINAFADHLRLQTIGSLQLPAPAKPPAPPPPVQPPTECFPSPPPAPPPSEPPPIHRPIPPPIAIPKPTPDPCPTGFAPTATGGCVSTTPAPPPPPAAPPGKYPTPPPIIPPGPPVQCPEGFVSDGRGGCIDVGTVGPCLAPYCTAPYPGAGYCDFDPLICGVSYPPGIGGVPGPNTCNDPWLSGGCDQWAVPY